MRRPVLVVLIQLLALVSTAAAQGRTVRGVVLDTANRPVASGNWVITGRRLAGIPTGRRDSGPSRCGFTIYVDGVRLNIPKEDRLTGRDTSTVVIDDFVNPLSIAGIEIYSRPTDAPSRFQLLNGSCGVALIWTKRS